MTRTIIVISDLLFVLALRVDDNFRNEASQDIFKELGCEVERRPVVSLFQNLENVTLNIE